MGEYFKRLGSFILDILQTVVMAVAIFMTVYLFLMRPHQVSGRSMIPNFQDGEYLLTEKVSYRLHEPKRGDVVVFSAPPTRRQEYIKRIIGVPGDRI
ncbi:MAG: signal peptidase I, partial [bacterium]|nr:signal peptidase I [bacterium]